MESILFFVLVLGLMVLVHELGHFITAKRVGIKVEEFGIGFPPRIWSFKKGETEYSINIVPLGGFVKLLGEEDPQEPRSFARAPKKARALVLAAGALMNLLAAWVVFTAAFMAGWPTATATVVDITRVSPGSPAAEADLLPGDVVVGIAGQPVTTSAGLVAATKDYLGRSVELMVQRGDAKKAVTLTPRLDPPANEGPVGIGIMDRATKVEPVSYPLGEAVLLGTNHLARIVILTFYLPALVIRGYIPLDMARPVGPVGIYQIASQAAEETVATGLWFPILSVAGTLGVGLALANILPIPGLDGGRLLFVLLEALRGRRISPKKEGLIHFVGMGILLAIVVVISYYDIFSPLPAIDWGTK